MKRAFASILASAMMLFALAGCSGGGETTTNETQDPAPEGSSQATEPVTISVGVPTAPPALPVLHMMDAQLLGENVTIDLNVWNAPEELLAMVQGGEHDMYAFPLTVVSTLYNKGLDVRLMNVNTWGVTYFLTTDPDFTTWSDLAGKTVLDIGCRRGKGVFKLSDRVGNAGHVIGVDWVAPYIAEAKELFDKQMRGKTYRCPIPDTVGVPQ